MTYSTQYGQQAASARRDSRCFGITRKIRTGPNKAEAVYIVDTDGSLYSNADAYDPQLRHGNIFEESLEAMKESDNYLRAVAGAQERMDATCTGCRFHGACSGYIMGEATPEERGYDQDRLTCGVAKPAHDYLEEILVKLGLVDEQGVSLLTTRIVERIESSRMNTFP